MTREEMKKMLPIIQAYVDGKEVEYYNEHEDEWVSFDREYSFFITFYDKPEGYRIKPEPKYRPFKDAEECWNEMLKHVPFGWIKDNVGYELISSLCDIEDEEGGVAIYAQQKNWSCGFLFNTFTFADGSAFGIKEGGEE